MIYIPFLPFRSIFGSRSPTHLNKRGATIHHGVPCSFNNGTPQVFWEFSSSHRYGIVWLSVDRGRRHRENWHSRGMSVCFRFEHSSVLSPNQVLLDFDI